MATMVADPVAPELQNGDWIKFDYNRKDRQNK